jgi:hypothetical protein
MIADFHEMAAVRWITHNIARASWRVTISAAQAKGDLPP